MCLRGAPGVRSVRRQHQKQIRWPMTCAVRRSPEAPTSPLPLHFTARLCCIDLCGDAQYNAAEGTGRR
jgi:hypothetical protein